MTLTYNIPSLRRTLADPLNARLWPAHTTASIDDITVAGVSLDCLVDWCGTPCVHSSDAGCVIVARVETVEVASDADIAGGLAGGIARSIDVWVDAELSHCDASWSEARMIGRVSTAHSTPMRLRPSSDAARVVSLPADLRAGDLIAVPSGTIVAVRDLHRGAWHPERYEG